MQQKSIVQYAVKFFKKLCSLTIEMWGCVWYHVDNETRRKPRRYNMYTEKQIAILTTLLNKWNNRNPAYNSIIVSECQFFVLRNLMTEANYCGHVSYYGVTPEGRSFSACYNRSRNWYTMVFQATEAENVAAHEAEAAEQEARFQSAEYQAKAKEALARINAGKARAFDKAICKNAGLI